MPEMVGGGCGAAHLKLPACLVCELALYTLRETGRTERGSCVPYSKEAGGICDCVYRALVLSITQVNDGRIRGG